MDEYKKIQNFALKLLTGRMFTIKDLQEKLHKKFPNSGDEVKKNILELEEKKLLNDEEYIRAYLNYELTTNFRGKFGYFKKLYENGIPKELFEKVWNEINPNELDIADTLLKNNEFRFINEKDKQKRKMKIQRFLMGRGFDFGIIKEFL